MNKVTPRFFLYFLLTIITSSIFLMALNYFVDPWMYFSDSRYAIDTGQGRKQNAGVARNTSFSTLVIGTSLSQETSAADVEALFSGSAAVLSIPAGTGKEQYLTVKNAIRHQSIEHIIWELHPAAFVLDKDDTKTSSFPLYLYDNKVINDIYYLFNLSNFEKSLSNLRAVYGERVDVKRNWKNLYATDKNYEYGCPSLLRIQIKKSGMPKADNDLAFNKDNIIENISQNILSLVKENPKIQFHFFLPPFSKLYWGIIKINQPIRYSLYQQVANQALYFLSIEKNTTLYDFRMSDEITKDLNNYRDLTHYSPAISHQIITKIAQNKNGTTTQLVSDFDYWIKNFEPDSTIKNCLKD
jgi:hypothetical protein